MKERNSGQAPSHFEGCLAVVGRIHSLTAPWLEQVSNLTGLKHKAAER